MIVLAVVLGTAIIGMAMVLSTAIFSTALVIVAIVLGLSVLGGLLVTQHLARRQERAIEAQFARMLAPRAPMAYPAPQIPTYCPGCADDLVAARNGPQTPR